MWRSAGLLSGGVVEGGDDDAGAAAGGRPALPRSLQGPLRPHPDPRLHRHHRRLGPPAGALAGWRQVLLMLCRRRCLRVPL